MGFPNGDIKLSSNFELNVSKPIDSRNVITNYSDLVNISFKYAGMIVFVTETNKYYGLKNDLVTWEIFDTTNQDDIFSSAGNGLSIVSNVLELGGALNKNTSINTNPSLYTLQMGDTTSLTNSYFSLGNNNIKLGLSPFFGNQNAIEFSTSGNKMIYNNNIIGGAIEFNLTGSDSQFKIKAGLESGDYYAILSTVELTEDRNYNFPNQSGTFALTSDIVSNTFGSNGITKTENTFKLGGTLIDSTFIDTTGFDLTIGANTYLYMDDYYFEIVDTNSNYIALNGNNGIQIIAQGSDLNLTGNNVDINYNTGSQYTIREASSSYKGIFTGFENLTDDRTYTFQNESGTIAFLSDLSGNIFGSNGITKTENTVLLGGELIRDTIISADTYEFKIIDSNKLSFYKGGFNIGTGFNNVVQVISLQSDGKILVGGVFNTYNGVGCPGSLVRLNVDGSIDTTFNIGGAGFVNSVLQILLQSDGKILVGGSFTSYNGNARNRIIRLNSDGSIDISFIIGTGFNNGVNTVELQSDGKILVGGNFTTYNGNARNRIIRLNSDGSIDTSFIIGTGFNNTINAIKIQSDGKILVGGNFATYNGNTSSRIIRLNSDGSIDTSFIIGTGFNSTIQAISLQSDGKILVGGIFTTYNGNTSNRIIRLNSDGSIDTSFIIGTGFNNTVSDILLQSDDKILVGGNFITYDDVDCPDRLVRLNADGTLDTTFNSGGSGFNSGVQAITLQSDGEILIGGNFTTYNGVDCPDYLLRLNEDGSIDNRDYELFLDKDNLLYYGQNYHTKYGNRTLIDKEYVDIILNNYLALSGGTNSTMQGSIYLNDYGLEDIRYINSLYGSRIDFEENIIYDPSAAASIRWSSRQLINESDNISLSWNSKELYNDLGDITLNWNNRDLYGNWKITNIIEGFNNGGSGFNSTVQTSSLQSDGKILIGGDFTTYNGSSSSRIIRLNTNGSIDTSFIIGTGFDGTIYSILSQSDGKILVGGSFTTYDDNTSNRIIRLNSDGSIDTSFIIGTGFNGAIRYITIQSDDKILIGGEFTTYDDVDCCDGLVRLNADGTLDTTFNTGEAGFNNTVSTITIQSNGKILVGGSFTSYNGNTRNRIIRLNSDGSIDTSFIIGTGFNNTVWSIKIQSDGKILVGGEFTTYNGNTRNRIIRLNSDGSIDTSFIIGTGFNSFIFSTSLQSDGKILVGGFFTTYDGVTCSARLVRLNVDGSLDTSFNNGGTGFNSVVSYITIQSNGKILVTGSFVTYNGVDCPDRLVRLNIDGTINDIDIPLIVNLNSSNGLASYEDNYNEYYTDRTLVDKEYVNNQLNSYLINSSSIINETYYVSVQYGDDSMGEKGNIFKPFKTIKEAVNQSTSGNIIHVFAGLYNEYEIPTKSYLTIHLEDGVIIKPSFNNGEVAVFTDLVLNQAASNFRITGKGEILGNGEANNETTSLVASFADSKYYIEAKKVRSVSAWGQIGASIFVKDSLVDFEVSAYLGGELYFENCSFINLGNIIYGHGTQGFAYTFKNCYFERNGVNYDYNSVWGTDASHVLYIAPVFTNTQKANYIFDNCDFVQKLLNNDIVYIQSVNYDTNSNLQFINCKFYNEDITKKSIVFTTDSFNYNPISVVQSDGYENGELKMFFMNNLSNVDVDNVNTSYPMTNQLLSQGFFINQYFKLNSKFI